MQSHRHNHPLDWAKWGAYKREGSVVVPQWHLVKALTEIQHRKQTTSCPVGDEGKGGGIRLGLGVQVAKISHHPPTIYGFLVYPWRTRDYTTCTSPLVYNSLVMQPSSQRSSLRFVSILLMSISYFCSW